MHESQMRACQCMSPYQFRNLERQHVNTLAIVTDNIFGQYLNPTSPIEYLMCPLLRHRFVILSIRLPRKSSPAWVAHIHFH